MELIKTFPYHEPRALHPQRRLSILRRTDGLFTIAEEYLYEEQITEGESTATDWARLPPFGLFGTSQEAEQEALAQLEQTG